ncbi:MAG TPA: carboxypeptidase-like regulatory domain-containing protein, partial [Flavisolibacter sp.]|nr:carboxypeptidase-like regulatory domain-containing protein [Flavisolibacter sp.]
MTSAQNKFTLNGYTKDSTNGESIIGATVSINGKSVTSNQYGFFSITLEEGEYDVLVSHVSYLTQAFHISLHSNVQQTIFLLPKSAALTEVVVYSRRRDANVRSAQMGKVDLSINQIKNIPAFLGEVDILKTIQLMPGVRNAGEGNAGFYVRGGGPDQNLILLDDAVVYNTGHLFGFFSIFNSDAIKNVSLIKGGMPAQYGGRLSSVLDVSMKEG